MKNCKMLFVFSIVMILATSVFADCLNQPKDGTYTTSDGTMIGGRASEAWCPGVGPSAGTMIGGRASEALLAGVGPGRPGNTENAMSWNGANLGSQWKVWGQAIDGNGAIETGRYFDVNGTGWIDYQTTYTGGQFWLSGNHTWGNGTGDFTGTVSYYNVGARVNYLRGQAVGVTSNIFMTGVFDDCPHCSIEYSISNALSVWQTGAPDPMPSNYPPFLCGASDGELYDVCCVVLKIFCTPAAAQTSTWGMIKELYR